MDTNKPLTQMTDQEILNQMVPAYVRAINWIYNHSFAYANRFLDYLDGAGTRQMVADYEASEARKPQE